MADSGVRGVIVGAPGRGFAPPYGPAKAPSPQPSPANGARISG